MNQNLWVKASDIIKEECTNFIPVSKRAEKPLQMTDKTPIIAKRSKR